MTPGSADLHVHSYYSDGTMSPAQILALAVKKGVGLLAIADHDVSRGSEELMRISEGSGVKCVPAVEVTASDHGHQIHVLAYHPDFRCERFLSFIAEGRKKLDDMSVRLIEKLSADRFPVSVSDYQNFPEERTKGGWKALRYMLHTGVTASVHEGMKLYDKYGVGYETAGFPDVKTAIGEIRNAGGTAIIAHPACSIPKDDLESDLSRFISYGASGAECFYSEYDADMTSRCLSFCIGRGLDITCGSDFHGDFLTREFGIPRVSAEFLRLNGIINQ